MKVNEDGFPDYLEVREKFDLEHNKELDDYIQHMYDIHYKLQHETFWMSPEKIRFLNKLDECIRDYYFVQLLHACTYTREDENNKLLEFLKDEPDKQATAQKLCNVYMKECLENFKDNINCLFSK